MVRRVRQPMGRYTFSISNLKRWKLRDLLEECSQTDEGCIRQISYNHNNPWQLNSDTSCRFVIVKAMLQNPEMSAWTVFKMVRRYFIIYGAWPSPPKKFNAKDF